MFGNIGSDLIFLQKETIVLMTWAVLHKPVGYLSVHVNGKLKEDEVDISGTKKDVDFEIAEDSAEDNPTQSVFLESNCWRNSAWFAQNNAIREEIQLLR